MIQVLPSSFTTDSSRSQLSLWETLVKSSVIPGSEGSSIRLLLYGWNSAQHTTLKVRFVSLKLCDENSALVNSPM